MFSYLSVFNYFFITHPFCCAKSKKKAICQWGNKNKLNPRLEPVMNHFIVYLNAIALYSLDSKPP